MTRPGRTGYSPLRMWMSVPQIVVVVTRITASPAAAWGRGTSSTRVSFGAWNTVARIVAISMAGRRVSMSVTVDLQSGQSEGGTRPRIVWPAGRPPSLIVAGRGVGSKGRRSRCAGTPGHASTHGAAAAVDDGPAVRPATRGAPTVV